MERQQLPKQRAWKSKQRLGREAKVWRVEKEGKKSTWKTERDRTVGCADEPCTPGHGRAV